MNDIKLLGAIHLKSEPVGYRLCRENGQSAINFVHFLSPVRMVIEGLEQETAPNACIIYTPGFRQEYYAAEQGFVNNFVTFQCADSNYIHRYNLPINEIFYIEQAQRITDMVEYISWTMTDYEVDHSENIKERIALLLSTLSELQVLSSPRVQRAYNTKKRFIQLRERVARNPGAWTVDKMAKTMFLTRSYFYTQYQEHFNISPSEDLGRMIVGYAQNRLRESDCPIAVIAKECGYDRPEYFIRKFRQSVGVTPGRFRRAHRNGENP